MSVFSTPLEDRQSTVSEPTTEILPAPRIPRSRENHGPQSRPTSQPAAVSAVSKRSSERDSSRHKRSNDRNAARSSNKPPRESSRQKRNDKEQNQRNQRPLSQHEDQQVLLQHQTPASSTTDRMMSGNTAEYMENLEPCECQDIKLWIQE